MSNIYIANETKQIAHVMVTPNTAWNIADLVVDTALLMTGIAELKAGVTALRALPSAISTVGELGTVMRAVTTTAAGAGAMVGGAGAPLVTFFKNHSTPVDEQQVKNVYGSDVWTYFKPSAYADLLGAETMHLMILYGEGRKYVEFNTNADHSWIVTSTGVVRAKYGHVWVHDAAAGSHDWVQK